MITKDAENFNSNTYWFDIHLPISEGWETAELEREYFLRRDKSEGAGVLLHLMLLRSISAHYEIIGANLIHCRNVSHSQTIPDFLSLRSSWFIYHPGAEGEGIPFIFVIREQLWFIYHLGAWGGGGGRDFQGETERGSVVSDRVTGFKGGTFVNVQHILIFGKILFTSNIPHNF